MAAPWQKSKERTEAEVVAFRNLQEWKILLMKGICFCNLMDTATSVRFFNGLSGCCYWYYVRKEGMNECDRCYCSWVKYLYI